MTEFVDAHAHLAMPAYGQDLEEVLERAASAGVGGIMTCATSLEDAATTLRIARAHAERGLLASVGFHPHEADRWTDASEFALRDLIDRNPEIAAIGEVGLDFHYDFSPAATQRAVLRRQIRLARAVGLPLIIHCRDARDDLRRILIEEKASDIGGMLHCFTEDVDFARFCLDQGLYVSISGIVTFRKAEALREAVAAIPLERLLVETDSPYLAPVPHRGRRNEPCFVTAVARFIADLKRVPIERIAEATTGNYKRLFQRRARSRPSEGPGVMNDS